MDARTSCFTATTKIVSLRVQEPEGATQLRVSYQRDLEGRAKESYSALEVPVEMFQQTIAW